jgi:hypothetical protein
MKNLKFQLAIAAAAGLAIQSQAALYDFTFSGDGSAADGTISVVGGVATGGTLDVTAGLAQGTYSLYTWAGGGTSSVRVTGGTDLIVDNLVTIGANPFLDTDGLAFVTVGDTEGIDFSLGSGTTYNLAGFGADGYNQPNAFGTATLVAIPEPVSTTEFAGLSALGVLLLVGGRISPKTV